MAYWRRFFLKMPSWRISGGTTSKRTKHKPNLRSKRKLCQSVAILLYDHTHLWVATNGLPLREQDDRLTVGRDLYCPVGNGFREYLSACSFNGITAEPVAHRTALQYHFIMCIKKCLSGLCTEVTVLIGGQ